MRVKDAIVAADAPWRGVATNVMVNPTVGGANGYSAPYDAYVSNAAYVQQNLKVFVIDVPRGFEDIDSTGGMALAYKAMIELHSKSITGIQSGLEAEFHDTPFGGANEIQQTLMNITRQRSVPVHTHDEKWGLPFYRIYNTWMRYLGMNPDTKIPEIVNMGLKELPDFLPDYTTATHLYVETDITARRVIEAWLVSNIFPTTDGGRDAQKQAAPAAGQGREFQVEMSAITQMGKGVNDFAQLVIDNLALTGANPSFMPAAFQKIAEELRKGNGGYSERIAEASRVAVR